MTRIWAFLLLSLVAVSAYALPSLEDVEHAVHRGDYAAAENMTREVVAARPNNAKAHYILAELLAHQGKLGEARTQAATARQLDPEIHFTAPDRFRQFEAELRGGKGAAPAPSTNPRKVADQSGGGSTMVWIVLLLGAGALFVFLRRRPGTPPGYGTPYPTAPNGVPPGGYAGQGYPPGYSPYGSANPPSGVSPVAAGLGGIAAGMVAEHLIEEALDRRHDHADHPSGGTESPLFGPPGSDSLEDRPIDFGNGGDWGGDSGGGGGDSGGFDGGSGSDWS